MPPTKISLDLFIILVQGTPMVLPVIKHEVNSVNTSYQYIIYTIDTTAPASFNNM